LAFWKRITVLAFCGLISTGLFAAQITGTVTNGTTGKPAANTQVVLLSLDSGMNEVAKAGTDGQGNFVIDVPDPNAPHLLRVNFQNVNYYRHVEPGTASAEITIYNSARQVEGIFEDARVYQMQAEGGQLDVSVKYTLRNNSQPPRTKMDQETFQVELPAGAQLMDATAAGPSGMSLPASPVPTGKDNRYALVFPIRPGETQFQVLYKMPYSGSYAFNFTTESQLSELGILLPKSMQFSGISRTFEPDIDEAGLAVYFVKNVPAHELVKFVVSGQGVAPPQGQGGEPAQSSQPSIPAGDNSGSPGSRTLWYAVGGMIVIVAAGGYWLWRRAQTESKQEPQRAPRSSRKSQARAGQLQDQSPPSMLEALKDELFQLERDRLDGKISQEDYEKSKAGLDTLIRRQLKKTNP